MEQVEKYRFHFVLSSLSGYQVIECDLKIQECGLFPRDLSKMIAKCSLSGLPFEVVDFIKSHSIGADDITILKFGTLEPLEVRPLRLQIGYDDIVQVQLKVEEQ